MNKYLYDAVTNAFYPLDMQGDYERAGMWPKKGVEVDEGLFASFQEPPLGKMRIAKPDGSPAWADIPPPTHAQVTERAEQLRQSLMVKVDDITSDWRTELALGEIDDSDKKKLSEWMAYKRELKGVDIASAPDIVWPTEPQMN